ncbi:MAG TPA: L-histidine N(alpha)-methyltransferase [Candidatus Polarisedimenticolia bacterium]|nr:L-histidine N(alpha)-methyltransferase [Candidatus Polarisedimenticolia bacterium]
MSAQRARAAQTAFLDEMAQDVRAGLGGPDPKTLPSRYLYDDLGSALFDAIGYLPEYGLTRADERILRAHAGEIAQAMPGKCAVAELGSGTGRKTRWLLEALSSRRPVPYFPIDISSAALERCELELSRIPNVRVDPIEADYLSGLSLVASQRRGNERLLVLFLGSTIGNFEPSEASEFLTEVRRRLRPGDGFLLGTDLVKPARILVPAYDDALGVTAAFNLNLLRRLNLELDADFDPRRFEHQARWNESARRVEMHLVAKAAHTVRIQGAELEVPFQVGETIWTESSYKFEPDEPRRLCERSGYALEGQWLDFEWPFAESLFVAR